MSNLSQALTAIVKPLSDAAGMSEEAYYTQELIKAASGGSSQVLQDIKTYAQAQGLNDVVSRIDSQIAFTDTPQSRRLWADAVNGNDTTGTGLFGKPFATVEKAMSMVSGATSGAMWTIYVLNGHSETLTSAFLIKPNVRIIGLDAQPVTMARADARAIENDGTAGIYSFTNLAFSTGLKITVPTASTVNMVDCASSGFPQRFQFAAVADVAGSLAGKYFLINTPMNNYYVWYRVDAVGTDPAIAGRKGLVIDLVSNDTASSVATKTNLGLGSSGHSRYHHQDFTVTQSGVPAGSFQIRPVHIIQSNSGDAGDSGFTFTDVGLTPLGVRQTGIELIGNSATNGIGVNLRDCSFTSSFFMKFCSGNAYDTTFNQLAVDAGSVSASMGLSLYGCIWTTMALKGPVSLVKRDGRQLPGGNAPGVRLITRVNSQPAFNADGIHQAVAVKRFVGSITSGSDLLTIVSGATKSNLPAGQPLYGPGIPADTFVGDSQDLGSTQIRMVSSTGSAANATQTRASASIDYRPITFEDGALNAQLQNQTSSLNSVYSPLASGDWPALVPFTDAQAIDVLASRKLTKETKTASALDITNQYVDLANNFIAGSLRIHLRPLAGGYVMGDESVEYSVSTYTDANGLTKTRITFLNAWATAGSAAILENDVMHIQGLIQREDF